MRCRKTTTATTTATGQAIELTREAMNCSLFTPGHRRRWLAGWPVAGLRSATRRATATWPVGAFGGRGHGQDLSVRPPAYDGTMAGEPHNGSTPGARARDDRWHPGRPSAGRRKRRATASRPAQRHHQVFQQAQQRPFADALRALRSASPSTTRSCSPCVCRSASFSASVCSLKSGTRASISEQRYEAIERTALLAGMPPRVSYGGAVSVACRFLGGAACGGRGSTRAGHGQGRLASFRCATARIVRTSSARISGGQHAIPLAEPIGERARARMVAF